MNEHAIPSRDYIVLPREDGRWIVTRLGTPSESAVYSTLDEAVEEGRKRARNANVRLRFPGDGRPDRPN